MKATLISGLFFLALGGWLLHARIHPFAREAENLIPFLAGLVSVFAIPFLFSFKKTIVIAYLYNGFSVILGTITMAHYSMAHYAQPLSFTGIMTGTIIADVFLLWGKFAIGKALFDLEFLHSDEDEMPGGRYFRYPNSGWWLVHLIGWSAVYALGHILWK